MKNIIVCFYISIFLVGCSSDSSSTISSPSSSKSKQEIQVDEGISTIEITIPANLFGEEGIPSQAEINKSVKEEGFISGVRNPNGSVTYAMSKAKHDELLAELRISFDEAIQEFLKSELSFKTIEFNNQYTILNIRVDGKGFEKSITAGFAIFGLALQASLYQIFTGVGIDNYSLEVRIFDYKSDQIIDIIKYPEAFEDK